MSTFKNLEEAKEFFEQDRFATENGITLDEIGDDWARTSVELTENHRNAQGGIMGGVIFTLADLALAAASNNIHSPSVAQQMSVNFLSGSRGTKLFAYAKCRKDGKTSGVYNIDVTDDLGRDIAQITGIAFKK
ncbi:MAG: PaaI family thioesterase [Firmicutes bacterium]|nr:PaaI family thioesterase [Bacillota bacterium]